VFLEARPVEEKKSRMNAVQTSSNSALFGSRAYTSVSRALSELQARRPIRIDAAGEALLVLPVEGLDPRRLAEFASLCRPAELSLVITQQRALKLGLDATAPMTVPLLGAYDAAGILDLVAEAKLRFSATANSASPAAAAAIQLAKLTHGLPAVLAANMLGYDVDLAGSILTVDAEAVDHFAADAEHALVVASEASIPLASGVAARFVVFRDAAGTDQVAIIVGTPDLERPVPVRLHSACLTGDVFGSRRCDCGDQLQLALARLENLGGGVVLYLAQEGRGLGLVNKMRTYRLQDSGLDTFDANTTLGFDDDERDYLVAALMLRTLNCSRILLLTNNPAKLDGLAKAGIEIVARVPLEAPINPHNKGYLATKAARSGHQFFNLKALAAKNS
jgi:GTP cyclohydrolase II